MLNDLKDWAAGKGEQAKELVGTTAQDVSHNNVMEWTGTSWLVLLVVGFLFLMGLAGSLKS